MEREIPNAIVVGPYRYQISFDEDAAYDYGYFGTALNRSRRIKLDPRQSDTELPQTILHEVLHCLGSVYEIPVWESHTKDDHGKDKIDLMATALLQWLRANQEVVDWLQRESG